jgi:hypothetical protein
VTVSKEGPELAGDALILRDAAFGGPQDEGCGDIHAIKSFLRMKAECDRLMRIP